MSHSSTRGGGGGGRLRHRLLEWEGVRGSGGEGKVKGGYSN